MNKFEYLSARIRGRNPRFASVYDNFTLLEWLFIVFIVIMLVLQF